MREADRRRVAGPCDVMAADLDLVAGGAIPRSARGDGACAPAGMSRTGARNGAGPRPAPQSAAPLAARGAALALLFALAGCAVGPGAPGEGGEAAAGLPSGGVHARGVERRRAEIDALEASAERNPAAAARVRTLRREIAQIEDDARIGADTSPAARHGVRF